MQSAGLLPRDVSMKISYIASTKLGVSELLDAIEAMVNLNSENFYKFIDVLEKDITMWPICNKLCSTGERAFIGNLKTLNHVYTPVICA